MIIDEWQGCYPSQWKGLLVPDAFSHPAKFSSKLIRRIYFHLVDEMRWLSPGDSVIDPFGGVGLGALDALRYGLNWIGNELEPRFVDLSNQNIALWNSLFAGKLPRWGTARLIQGDSRYLVNAIAQAKGAISSPPYADSLERPNGIDASKIKRPGGANSQSIIDPRYGFTPGQLAALPPGDFQAALSSPPFIQTTGGTNVTSKTGPLSDPALIKRHAAGNQAMNAYGVTPGQLSELREGDYQGVISSPPYEGSISKDAGGNHKELYINNYGGGNIPPRCYSDDPENLGNKESETFWTAARAIIEQTYQVLVPDAHAVWVVKGYIKGGKLIDFPHQWQAVCESAGFVTLHEHHAMLTKHNGTSRTLTGEEIEHIKSSKSFFRRLAEKNGAPEINWETVLCMEKPAII